MMKNFRAVYIVRPKSKHEYPQIYRQDSAEFPHLIDEVEDESDIFIVDEATGEHYPSSEFFAMLFVVRFSADVRNENDSEVQWP